MDDVAAWLRGQRLQAQSRGRQENLRVVLTVDPRIGYSEVQPLLAAIAKAGCHEVWVHTTPSQTVALALSTPDEPAGKFDIVRAGAMPATRQPVEAPEVKFAGVTAKASHVIYCIDASGSMGVASGSRGPSIDMAKEKMLQSIAKLSPSQDFDVVFFRSGARRSGSRAV